MAVEIVRGRDAVVHFDGHLCIHSRGCVLDRPDVFVPNVKGAWIHPDAAAVEDLERLAHNCPSGAIRIERLDGGPEETAPLVNTARIRENGPLAVNAALVVGEHQATRATLCRCGASANKPYCDGSHSAAGFTATGEPATQASEPLAARNGPLTVTPLTNGPLRVVGNLEVVSGTGRTVNRVTETYLCRCGHSGNKPYCDGSHKRAGFVG
ncbi:CDGSH iron-sulfur domain-containing protein [Labrys wisconsinensis]|uniref:CDGSH-type Zn-finger protein/uncharacterized Fe-S cluster protein YjdI n=1 Tax=Labrys wisconsinensis TaxID=425677 RepID=A0ABU0JM60_9HYPH|nr:CDGSH iron-sulfur domain-containing protein [Labrys wisconsinensis]MDQ0474705.1 CDGSH-type Zn-finger protein/uncharacterized Fe-S cluster protein YjdI [Labrys wisconsinensis]